MEDLLQRLVRQYQEKTARHASRQNNLRLYERLHSVLKDAIINNDVPKDYSLPATRKMAEALGLSRTTVIKAYELLRLEGYIYSKTGSGHQVKGLEKTADGSIAKALKDEDYPEISIMGRAFQSNTGLINSTEDQSIAFRPGLPPLDIFPVNQWKNLSNLYWRHIKSSALSYSPSSGLDQLKHNLANYLNLSRGLKCDHRQIIVVSGSLQSLYLSGSVLLDPGDEVVMENPTFPNVHSIFKGMQAKISALPVDEEGLQTELLPRPASKVKIAHSTPACHYPSGKAMSLKRKKELLQWASEEKVFLIENDYEHEVHGYYEQSPSLFELDQEDRVIYMGTFNRLLHPSIRIGYMILPPYLIEPVEALLKHSHRFVPSSIQVVLNSFIEKKYLHNHIRKLMQVSEQRLALFKSICESEFEPEVKVLDSDVPSLHVVLKLPPEISDSKLVAFYKEHQIVTHAYSKCAIGPSDQQGLILGYSSVREPVIRRKVKQMARLYRESGKLVSKK